MLTRKRSSYRLQREVIEWKQAFLDLYNSVDSINEVVDSKKLDNVLYRFGQKAGYASDPAWWERNN